MGFVYLEFISRKPGVDLAAFRHVLAAVQTGWAADYSEDELVLGVGRTWRVGPEPEYLFAWHSPAHGLERFDGWERSFLSGEADQLHEPFKLGARIDRAGCYEALLEPSRGTRKRYYAEWFDVHDGAVDAEVAAYLEGRRHVNADLNLAALRIGALAPDPAGLAVWGVDSWADLQPLARPVAADAPIRVVTASLYADVGLEQH